MIPTAISTSRQEPELIQNMLAQVGVTMRIEMFRRRLLRQIITPGQFDFTVFSWMGTPHRSASKSIYVKPATNASEQDIHQNFARIGSDEIDSMFNQAFQARAREAIVLANQIDALIWKEVHSLTLYQRPSPPEEPRELGAFGFAT